MVADRSRCVLAPRDFVITPRDVDGALGVFMQMSVSPSESSTVSTSVARRSRLFEWVRTAAALSLVALSVSTARASLADHYVVPSGSMRPTLIEGDRIVVDKMAFGLRIPFTHVWLLTTGAPDRKDVVVLESPEDGGTLVKRVMGLPGETVAVRSGVVFVDGQSVEKRPSEVPGWLDFGPTTLGPDEYLVLGDNRGNSHDGRAFGPVRARAILGRVKGVVWREGGFTWRSL